MVIRRIARPLLSTVFINGGIDALRSPADKAKVAAPVIDAVDDVAAPAAEQAAEAALDALPDAAVGRVPTAALPPWEDEVYVRANGAVQVVAGLMLATGRAPRLASAALAASLVPTTLGGHRFWEAQGQERTLQKIEFAKNLSLLGGLILAAVDTEGRPGVAWRMRHLKDESQVVAQAAKVNAVVGAKAARAEAKAAKHLARANAQAAGKGGKVGVELAADAAQHGLAAAKRGGHRAAERAAAVATDLQPVVQHALKAANERAASVLPAA